VHLELELERRQGPEREQQVLEVMRQAAVVEEAAAACANLCMVELGKPADTAVGSTLEEAPHRVTWLEYPYRVNLCMVS
jgi:hypothetical protein